MAREVQANEATAIYRRVYFDLRTTVSGGLDPALSEAGGQPQISTNGGGWTNTGIGTLVAIGSGRYYADVTQGAVATAGDVLETRYKSGTTIETPGDTIEVVAHNPRALPASVSTAVWSESIRSLTTFGTLVADTVTAVWAAGTRTLTSVGTLVADIWAAPSRTLTGYGTLATDISTAVWNAATRSLTTYGSLVTDIVTAVWAYVNRTLTDASNIVAGVWAAPARLLTAFGFNVTVGSNLDKSGYALSGGEHALLIDGVWDEAMGVHLTGGSTGAALNAAGSSGDPWATAVPSAYAAGQAGYVLGTQIPAAIATRSTLTAAQVDTLLSALHGTGLWTDLGGIGNGSNTVTVLVQDSSLVPLIGQMVTIRNSTQTQTVAGPIPTDSLGQAVFNLDDGTYMALVRSTALYLPLPAFQIVVNNAPLPVTLTLTPVTGLVPSAPDVAVLTGTLVLLTGAPAAYVDVTFFMATRRGGEAGLPDGPIITVGEPVVVTTDAQGTFQTELIRTDFMTMYDPLDVPGYWISCQPCGLADFFLLVVPSTDLSLLLPES